MKEAGLLTLTESEWKKAKRRKDVIAPLAALEVVGQKVAEEAAASLGITTRHLYRLMKRYKAVDRRVTDLISAQPKGGRGQSRLAPEVEVIISEVIKALYLTRQRRSKAVITREIRKRCLTAGLRPPSYNTIDSRIAFLDPALVVRKRQGSEAARRLLPAAGETPESAGPLELVQMDHTKVDVIVVDEVAREPIGRPSLTLAIDTFTRSIVGMLLSLEAPSATSVGLCLSHVVMDKAAWLEQLGLEIGMWAMHGKPIDNGPDFKSEALKRGCEQHGIDLDYRPKKQPHFGGIIERVIGTAMTMAHEVPGTTFSNTEQRGTYKSESRRAIHGLRTSAAILTLRELEKWRICSIIRKIAASFKADSPDREPKSG